MSSEKQFEFTKENIDIYLKAVSNLQKKGSRAAILAHLRENKQE